MDDGKTGVWVVEVRRTNPLERIGDGWSRIAECSNGETAIEVADALHNLMQTGLIRNRLLQVRTHLVQRKE